MEHTHGPDFDVLVIGGGAAGLSGALALGRSRRSVAVIDAGEPRNAPAGHIHNYLGREGTPPGEFLAAGRAELAGYGVEVANDRVVDVRATQGPETGFAVALTSGREMTARRVLVATGVTDDLPDVPGLAQRWGRDVLHCPYCHGWEVRDRVIAVLATNSMAIHQALLFRQLSEHVTLVLTADAPSPGTEDLERLAARGIRVIEARPTELVITGDAVTGMRLESGEVLDCEAVVVAPRFRASADFLERLGILPEPLTVGEESLGTRVPTDPNGATAVPGVWVAGNLSDPMAQVIASAAAGLRAGAVINADLVNEDTRLAVEFQHTVADFFEPDPWDRRYAASEAVWSGRVNPQLEAEAGALPAGRALEVGSGEGADAIWLAERGWSVTAVDFSTVALERAAKHAAAAGVADCIEWRHRDVRSFVDGPEADERWDLVSSQFMHLPDGGMVDLTRTLASVVAPGGTLLVVGHHPSDLGTGLRHGRADYMFTPEDLLPALDQQDWDIVTEVRERAHTGAHTGEGHITTVHDSVLRARRRA